MRLLPAAEFDVALGVHLDSGALEEPGGRGMTDGHEEAGQIQSGPLTGDRVLQLDRLDAGVADHVDDLLVPVDLDLVVLQDAILHGLRCPEFVATVDDVHGGSELRQVRSLLHCTVTASDHPQWLVTEHRQAHRHTRRTH